MAEAAEDTAETSDQAALARCPRVSPRMGPRLCLRPAHKTTRHAGSLHSIPPRRTLVSLLKIKIKPGLADPKAGRVGWDDNQTFYYTSECDGFNHLYEISYDGETRKQLTSGPLEIDRVELSRDKSLFYITSSQGDFAERNLWSMPVKGGPATRITKAVGMH